jgi:regulator of protease activity HflC (stomatin/prohibitin superfamily)
MLLIAFCIFAAIAVTTALILLYGSVYLVKQAEVILVERLGSYERTLGPGLHFTVPFMEKPRSVIWTHLVQHEDRKYRRFTNYIWRIDLRESVYDFPKQHVITRDNVTIEISTLLYYQIIDPKAAVYEVCNLPEAIEKLTQTTLRNVIGSMDFDESLVSRDRINQKLRVILDEATDKWGVKVNRVELQEINPPADVRHAMEKQMRAERDRRAVILEAEGKKRAAILEAEGAREADILVAQGTAQARVINAQSEAEARVETARAEAQAIALLRDSLPAGIDPQSYLVAMQYIKALPQMTAGKDDKLVVVPYDASSLIGSLATIKKVFSEVQ